jgi:tetratricopeptide (TPR) repeat protein
MTPIQVGDVIENRYRVLSTLGSGGMSTLYRVADQAREDEGVALKAVKLEDSVKARQANLERFQREFQILTQLRHPNLVRVYNYGITSAGDFYFTMALIPGQDLESKLGHMEPVDTVPIIVQLCRALAYLHARDVVHGDLKPGNVLLSGDEVKIIDFGVALEVGDDPVRASYYTPGYTAPEARRRWAVDPRADLYSLGALWYALLLGEPPQFVLSPGTERLIRLNLIEALENQTKLPLAVSTIVTRLLATAPQERYPSANAVIIALNKATDSQYVLETRETARSYALRGRFVGRAAEMQILQDVWSQTLQGQGKLALVEGESGVGKSRLLEEFAIQAELDGARVAWGRCVESDSSAYHPWREVLRVLVHYVEGTNGLMDQRLGGVLATLLPELWQRSYMAQASPPADLAPRAAQQRLNDGIAQVLQSAAGLRPTLIMIEDAHWADEATIELLRYLTQIPPQTGLQICLTFDPTLAPPSHPLTTLPHDRVQHIPLHNLDPGTTTDLVNSMLGMDRLDRVLVERVQQVTDGNVFFVQELVRSLAEDGVVLQRTISGWEVNHAALQRARLPEGISQVVWQRLRHLSPATLNVLQRAAIVGSVFWDGAVRYISPCPNEQVYSALHEATQEEMVLERQASIFKDQREFLFSKSTVREVSYERVAEADRQAYHKCTADWLMARSSEQAAEQSGLIGKHLEAAGEKEQAAIYLRRAGEQAVEQFANAEAVDYFSRALTLTPEADHSTRFALLLAREKVYDLQGMREAQLQDLAAMERLAGILEDDGRRAQVALRRSHLAFVTGDYTACTATARQAIDLAQATQDIECELLGYLGWGRALSRQGNYEAAQARYEQGLKRIREVETNGDRSLALIEANAWTNLGVSHWYQGDHGQASSYYERALHIYHEIDHPHGEASALNNLGLICLDQGDYATTRSYYEQAWRICHEIGDRRGEGIVLGNLGEILLKCGDYADAQSHYEKALHICRAIGDRPGEAFALSSLSQLFHRQGDDETALEYSREALQVIEDVDDLVTQANGWMNLGYALVGMAQLVEAEDVFQRALTLWRESGQSGRAIEAVAGLAHVALAGEDVTAAQARADEIVSYMEHSSLDSTDNPAEMYLICYRVLQAGQDPRAQTVLKRGYRLLQERASKISEPELRRSFLENVSAHREIVRHFDAP